MLVRFYSGFPRILDRESPENILRMANPSRPLRVNRTIAETPSEEMATRMITVERTKPVFLARFPKSV